VRIITIEGLDDGVLITNEQGEKAVLPIELADDLFSIGAGWDSNSTLRVLIEEDERYKARIIDPPSVRNENGEYILTLEGEEISLHYQPCLLQFLPNSDNYQKLIRNKVPVINVGLEEDSYLIDPSWIKQKLGESNT